MPLNEYQLGRCLHVMDKLKRRKISELFFKPLDLALNNLPSDYSEKITKLIDLSIIRENLVSGIYNTVEDWKKDVNILWENFFKIFLNDDPQYLMAKELQEVFNNLSELISDDPTSDWETKLSILKDNFLTLSKNEPKLIFGNGITSLPDSSSIPSTKKRSSSTTKSKKKQPSNSATAASDQEPHGKTASKYYQQMESSNEPLQQPSSESLNTSSDIIIKLQEDINAVANDDNMPEMINIIKQNEPSFQNNENEEDEVDLENLSSKTLAFKRSKY